jgi:hypothetical protein
MACVALATHNLPKGLGVVRIHVFRCPFECDTDESPCLPSRFHPAMESSLIDGPVAPDSIASVGVATLAMAIGPLEAITLGGGGTENRFTFVLHALLQDATVASEFVSMLGLLPNAQIRATIERGIDGGRVDLQLEGGGLFAIIEVKVGAVTTDPVRHATNHRRAGQAATRQSI